VYCIKQI